MKSQTLLVVTSCAFALFVESSSLKAQERIRRHHAAQAEAAKPADSNWDQAGYEAFKQEMQERWERLGKTEQFQQIKNLINQINLSLGILAEGNLPAHRVEYYEKEVLYCVDYLREMLHLPLVKSKTVNKDLKDWIDKINKEMRSIGLVEKDKYTKALPTIAQKELLQEAQMIMGLLDEERAIISESGSETTPQYIAVGRTVDLDNMLFGIYHELGHIRYGDTDVYGTKPYYEKYEEYKKGQSLQNFAQEHPKLNAQLDKMAEYVAKAKEKLNSTSETGKVLIDEIKKTSTFWNPPQDPKKYINIASGRAKESRADLFAVDQLLNQKRLETVLFKIRDWGTNYKNFFNYRTTEGYKDVHPSYLERILYMVGYLFSKGVDVNNELKHWENFGTCTDVRKMYGPWSRLHEKEMGELTRLYESKEKERLELDYKLWKINEAEELNASRGGQKQLISEIQRLLTELREDPENRANQKEALFIYNYLRELNNKSTIESVHQIDKVWLNKAEYELPYYEWKQEKQEQFEKDDIKSLAEKYKALIQIIEPSGIEWLRQLRYPKDQRYAFNYLRELLGQPVVETIGPKEREWLEEIKKQFS